MNATLIGANVASIKAVPHGMWDALADGEATRAMALLWAARGQELAVTSEREREEGATMPRRRQQQRYGPRFEFRRVREPVTKKGVPFIAALGFAALPESGPNWMIYSQQPDHTVPSGVAFVRVRESAWPLCQPGYYTLDVSVVQGDQHTEISPRVQGPFPTFEDAVAQQGIGRMMDHMHTEDWTWYVVPVEAAAPSWLHDPAPRGRKRIGPPA